MYIIAAFRTPERESKGLAMASGRIKSSFLQSMHDLAMQSVVLIYSYGTRNTYGIPYEPAIEVT